MELTPRPGNTLVCEGAVSQLYLSMYSALVNKEFHSPILLRGILLAFHSYFYTWNDTVPNEPSSKTEAFTFDLEPCFTTQHLTRGWYPFLLD